MGIAKNLKIKVNIVNSTVKQLGRRGWGFSEDEAKPVFLDLSQQKNIRCSPAQVWQRRTKEGTVQEGAVVLNDFNQLVFGAQHPRRHVYKEKKNGSHLYHFITYKNFEM